MKPLFVLLLSLTVTSVFAQNRSEIRKEANENKRQMPLPGWNIKTNLLYDVTTTFNLGVEFRTGGKTSVEIPVNYNPWTFKNDRKAKHLLVQPEFRWWPWRRTFDGHFFGLHAHGGIYNVAAWPHPPFSTHMKEHRFQGWLAGAGVSYGYRWNFNYRWAMEATVGAGYAYMNYDRFVCGHCGEPEGRHKKHYFGPTKVGVSLILGLGRNPAARVAPEIPIAPPPVVVYNPVLKPSFVVPVTEPVKVLSESGSAYLEFALNHTEIVPGFRNNAAELYKIEKMVESLKNNHDATIKGISIIGYASPEGTFARNKTLSEARAQALSRLIERLFDTPVPHDNIRVSGVGEDWDGLQAMIANSDMDDVTKDRLLRVIGEMPDPDLREKRMAAVVGQAGYRRMVADLYPALRRSDYIIEYTVTLPPVEDVDADNMNAAARALERGDVTSALDYLGKVEERGGAWFNNNGLRLWLEGDVEGALDSFRRAGEEGRANAAELEKHLRSLSVN